MTGAGLGSTIAVVLAGGDGEPLLERDVFGTTDPQRPRRRHGLLARCEHSDRLTAFGTRAPVPPHAPIPASGCLGLVRRHGERLLDA